MEEKKQRDEEYRRKDADRRESKLRYEMLNLNTPDRRSGLDRRGGEDRRESDKHE